MSDYTWLAQPIATVLAGALALGAATIAYRAAQAGVREQRRIAVRREVFDALNNLMQIMLEMQSNAVHLVAYRPAHGREPQEEYTKAIEAAPGLFRQAMFSAFSVKLLGFLQISNMALDVAQHFGSTKVSVQQAVFAEGDDSADTHSEAATVAMEEGQKKLSQVISAMEDELRTSGPDPDPHPDRRSRSGRWFKK